MLSDRTSTLVLYGSLGATIALPTVAMYTALGEYMSVAQVTFFLTLCYAAWGLKPAYGIMMDSYPIWGERRRPYLVVSNLGAAVLVWVMAMGVGKLPKAAFLSVTIFSQVFACVSDVAIDGLLCAVARDTETKKEMGKLQSRAFQVRDGTGLVAVLVGGALTQLWGPEAAFYAHGALYACNALFSATLLGPEKKERQQEDVREQIRLLAINLRRPALARLLAYQALIAALPSEGSAFFFFLTGELGFGKGVMGALSATGGLAKLVGLQAYRRWFRDVDVQLFFLLITLLAVFTRAAPLVLALRAEGRVPPVLLALSDDVVGDALNGLTTVPLLVVTAQLSDPRVETAVYTSSASVSNAASLISSAVSAALTRAYGVDHDDFRHLWLLILTCACLDAMVALPSTFLLPRGSAEHIVGQS